MTTVYMFAFGPFVVGVVLAVVWWALCGRTRPQPAVAVRGFTLAAGLLVLLSVLALRVVDVGALFSLRLPSDLSATYWDYRFAVIPAVGLIGAMLLVLPVQARGGRGVADLRRRSLVSYARGRWFVAPAVVLAVIMLLTLVAGGASEPDETTGRSMMYNVDLGGENMMGTSIYGWFYSVPPMLVVGLLLAVAVLGMWLVARPALADDRERDISARTARTRTLIVATTGTLLLHLGQIFGSLAATAGVRATFTTSEGSFRFWTTFSALEPALLGAGMVCAALGVALWGTVLLSGVPSRRRLPVAA